MYDFIFPAEADITCEFPGFVAYEEDSLCTLIICHVPDDIPGTVRTGSQLVYRYRDMLKYTCSEGYRHSAGDLTRSCGQDMHWTGSTVYGS